MKVFFTVPFLLVYGLLLLSWLWHRRRVRLAWGLTVVMTGGLYLCCTPAMTEWMLHRVGYHAPVVEPQALVRQGVQAIVVLGGGYYRSPETGPLPVAGDYTLNRLRYAARLSRQTGLPVAMTGVEGDAMARTFREDFFLNPAWVEGRSRTTAENAEFSARLLLPRGIRHVVLVTDAWHMERARRIFVHYGFTVDCAPTGFPKGFIPYMGGRWMPGVGYFSQTMFGLSELLGQVKYAFLTRASPATPPPAPAAATATGN